MFQTHNSANNGVMVGVNSSGGSAQQQQQQQNVNYNVIQQQQTPQTQQCSGIKNLRKKPYVKITEQPAGKALRFRYECEGRSAGSIPGVNSTSENKTYPTIEIVGYKGRAVVVVSCVTKDTPYRPHPHNLVGKEGCKKGVCTLEINSETMRAVFSNLGIQCVKKKDIEAALKAREEIRVDPFKTGFSHRFQPSSIDLNSVRLCFQVFMESEQKGRFTQPLPPVVSEPIFDKKAMSDLVICRLCSCSASVLGNTQIILLCEKVAKEDIAVRFYEEKNEQVIWEAFGEFQHTDVHKQTAITFKTPRYHSLDINEPSKVLIQLRRPSDGVTSEPLPFEYVPMDSDPAHLRRKRQKTGGDPMHLLLQQQQKLHQNDHPDGRQKNVSCWNSPNISAIKTEPRDTSPQPFGTYRGPPELITQPLSPSINYNHNNTPSPHSMAAASGGGLLQVVGSGGNAIAASSAMDIHDYGGFGHPHPQQHQHHAAHSHQQQQYTGNNPFASSVTANWNERCTSASGNGNNTNISNLNNTNPFTMQNLLSQTNVSGVTQHQQWNLGINNMLQDQQQHHQIQHQQQFQQLTNASTTDDVQIGAGAGNASDVSSHIITGVNNDHGPTLSNLLSFDSEQLVRINSEDQQMLRLNSEDLQISNLSIST